MHIHAAGRTPVKLILGFLAQTLMCCPPPQVSRDLVTALQSVQRVAAPPTERQRRDAEERGEGAWQPPRSFYDVVSADEDATVRPIVTITTGITGVSEPVQVSARALAAGCVTPPLPAPAVACGPAHATAGGRAGSARAHRRMSTTQARSLLPSCCPPAAHPAFPGEPGAL